MRLLSLGEVYTSMGSLQFSPSFSLSCSSIHNTMHAGPDLEIDY